MRRIPYEFIWRYASNVVRARWQRGPNKKLLPPMMASFHLTTKCNFRCVYCDDGSGNMYPDKKEKRLSTQKTIEVLELLRRVSPGLNITGGEPTLRNDIDEIFENIERLRFCPVSFNTNGFLIDRHLRTLRHIDYLLVSLDSINEQRSDELINLSERGQTARVKTNLQLASEYRREHNLKFDFVINTVIFPETIDDAWDVFEFCLQNNFYWTPMPYIVGKYPNPGLVDNPRWLQLIDEVARAKQNGRRICGNLAALKIIRDFKRFECYPTTHPTIHSNAEIHYPCSPLNKLAGNLLDIGDYHKAMKIGEQKHGPVPFCDARCHVGCHTESSTVISHPQEGVKELIRHHFGNPKRTFVLQRPERTKPSMPPPFEQLRQLPSLPPGKIRELRREGMIDHDWTSRLRIKSAANFMQPIQLTRATKHGCSVGH